MLNVENYAKHKFLHARHETLLLSQVKLLSSSNESFYSSVSDFRSSDCLVFYVDLCGITAVAS